MCKRKKLKVFRGNVKMSKKENNTLAMILIVVGIVMLLAVNSPDLLILTLVKLVGLAFTISGSYMMGEEND